MYAAWMRRNDPPTSSYRGERKAYRFATLVALVRAGYSPAAAEHLVASRERHLEAYRLGGESPASAAKRISRYTIPPERDHGWASSSRRDPAPPRGKKRGKTSTKRKGGQKRVSAKGIPYTTCSRGMKIQTLLFPKRGAGRSEPVTYTARSAAKWAAAHDFDPRSVDEVSPNAKFIRVRQYAPALFVKGSFRYLLLKGAERHGVRAIVGCPRLGIFKGRKKSKAGAQIIQLRPPTRRRKAA